MRGFFFPAMEEKGYVYDIKWPICHDRGQKDAGSLYVSMTESGSDRGDEKKEKEKLHI
jgi:hypothetical protein